MVFTIRDQFEKGSSDVLMKKLKKGSGESSKKPENTGKILETAKSVGAAAAGFEFPKDVFDTYAGEDKRSIEKITEYQEEIRKQLAEFGDGGNKVDKNQFALDCLYLLGNKAPKKLIKAFEEKLKKEKQTTPVLKSEPKPEPKREIKQEQKPNPETETEKKKEIEEEEFKEGLKKIKTGEELLAYLESLGEIAVRSEQEGVIFFPVYIKEVKKSLEDKHEVIWKTMRDKIREIRGDKETKKYEKKEEKLSFEEFKGKHKDIWEKKSF